ncbi:hypothetical protein EJ06DRAFT_135633 [Trichodelitschia bisporula]|uniref:Uncharacterized protein n=1 Tax=Trichodelitschia bisporula TaxID=703511 RepID=A0A6G1HPJ1_9PEZI|nr:hypothetical protein EJ06DRAFT_135633 [Trichodelitschia bisporula]
MRVNLVQYLGAGQCLSTAGMARWRNASSGTWKYVLLRTRVDLSQYEMTECGDGDGVGKRHNWRCNGETTAARLQSEYPYSHILDPESIARRISASSVLVSEFSFCSCIRHAARGCGKEIGASSRTWLRSQATPYTVRVLCAVGRLCPEVNAFLVDKLQLGELRMRLSFTQNGENAEMVRRQLEALNRRSRPSQPSPISSAEHLRCTHVGHFGGEWTVARSCGRYGCTVSPKLNSTSLHVEMSPQPVAMARVRRERCG